MKIATYNVNGVNGRLPVLLQWLETARPDVVCLQELKAQQTSFPAAAIRDAGYDAIWLGQKSWNGVAILARDAMHETRRGLPGDPDPSQSRYIEGAVNGVLVGCLYLPNGNPAPGQKFDYKLCWFEALAAHAASLVASGAPVVLAGDMSCRPSSTFTNQSGGRMTPSSVRRSETFSRVCWIRDGLTPCAPCTQRRGSTHSGITSGMAIRGTPG